MFTGDEPKIIEDIDSMPIAEARKAVAKGQFGSVGRPGRIFASEYISSKEAEERDKREAETLSISRKALLISKDTNKLACDANEIACDATEIASQARSIARSANIIAIIATILPTIMAAIAIIIALLNKN